MTSKTLCPACGHSPIPDGAESCPACHEPFAFLAMHKKGKKAFVDRKHEAVEEEATTFGGSLTGAVSAHPGPAAAVLTVGAVMWFLRSGGVLAEYSEPAWTYGVVGLNLGPAKLLCQVGMLLQLGLAAFLADGELDNPRHLFFCAHAALVLVMVVGEPGVARRSLGLVLGLLAAAGAVAAMATGFGAGARAPSLIELSGRDDPYRLSAPEGYRLLSRDEMAPHLRPPLSTATAKSVGFGNKVRRVYGALTIDRDPASQLIGGCQEHLRALGGVGDAVPVVAPTPTALGGGALAYALRTASGASGRLACGKLSDGRFVALAVVGQDPDPRIAEVVFEQVGSSLSLK
ncbi:MAG: zinc ribbon domain-containing protein [Myxococcaceae bacterium]